MTDSSFFFARSNHWLEAVKTFNNALNDKTERHLKDAMKDVITVAILDDGVDLEELGTTEYLKPGWVPVRQPLTKDFLNAWYESEDSHGTEMAKIIQLVWPRLSLYVAKLDTNKRVYKSTAASAAVVSTLELDTRIVKRLILHCNLIGNKRSCQERRERHLHELEPV